MKTEKEIKARLEDMEKLKNKYLIKGNLKTIEEIRKLCFLEAREQELKWIIKE